MGRKERTDRMKGLQIKSEYNPFSGEAQEIMHSSASQGIQMAEGRGKGEDVGVKQEGSNFTLETSLRQTLF